MRTVGLHFTYPDVTGRRTAEGGKRLAGTGQPRPDMPLVTVMTVCFNSAATIQQTFDSIRNQTYPNIEYLVIDGGSQDGTVELLKANTDIIDYFVSEPDKGLYHAMNKGLSLASGEYILVLNSDDWYEYDAIERLMRAQRIGGCDFSGGLARYVNADGSTHVLPKMRFDHATLLRMPLRHQTMLLPAALYDEVGPYDTTFPIIADFDYTIRLFQLGKTYFEVDAPLLNFRTTGVSSTALERLHGEHRALVKKVFPYLDEAEVHAIGDHSVARPEDFIRVANAHLDQPDFVLAVRDMLRDFGRLWGGYWQEADLDAIAAESPDLYPKISVVIPVHNAAGIIETTLRNVLNQDFPGFEVICVDDRGPDDSARRVTAVAARDPRVRLVANAHNRGPGAARNTGIRAARGDYIFFLDADDALPPGALSALYAAARAQDAEIVRGVFRVERMIHGKNVSTVKYPAGISDRAIGRTTLAETPALLETTEGHWACLYDRSFVETILYPEGLKMGEDSLFLIKALARADAVATIPDIVYVYQDSATSAMNSYTARKYLDEVEWRINAWGVLDNVGARARGDYFLYDYWDPSSLQAMAGRVTPDEAAAFYRRLSDAFSIAGGRVRDRCTNPELREIFLAAFARHGVTETAVSPRRPLRVAVLTSSEGGGAGIASQRCMEALRKAGQEAFSICIFRKTDKPDVFLAPLFSPAAEMQKSGDTTGLWNYWLERVALTGDTDPRCTARELFSTPDSLVNATVLGEAIAGVDLVHMHWVVGMLDYPYLDTLLGDKPVVWTLHDMNAFTGGCHYSEGCTNYRTGCHDCPLLAPGATAAQEFLERKRKGLSKIRNLHIVCPSQWLANCVQESALLGDRPVHVIPNVMPVERFVPTNKMVARLKLGIPLNRTYIAFGADSLANRRKGGHILAESLRKLQASGAAEGVEALFFGSSDLDVAIPARNMGYVTDPDRLALIYAAADVFAFPSLEDNAPQTVVEALLSGTPVVSFPVGNVPELVRHRETGYLAGYDDVNDFTAGMAWALEGSGTPEGKLRGVRGHLDAFDYHEPDSVVRRHLDLFFRIVDQETV